MANRVSPPPTPPYVSPGRRTPSPQPEDPEGSRSRRSPSPETCPICLDILDERKDRSWSDSCAHAFCFICLLEWSKNKRECPLCKKPFTAIIHRYKSHTDYKLHKLPPTMPVNIAQGENTDMQRMGQLRRMFMLNAFQGRPHSQDPPYRRSALTQRNSRLRPATTDYRRYIYTYGLYCEGAVPPNGSLRYRRVTPDFYRQNPAILHRLVPWLNRELVAILPHRDNVQYVLDHILKEIKRVDLRSSEFRRSIQPYILSNTDHFIHEFHQFAMSPLDMAGFDTHARYPSQPRGIRTRPHPHIPNMAGAGTGRVNITQPPGSSSSSPDSDIEIRETRPHAAATSSSMPHRDSRDNQVAGTSGSSIPHRRTRWDSPASTSAEHSRLTYQQRANVNRLERSLMTIDGTSGNVTYFHPPPSVLEAENHNYFRLVDRVRNILEDSEPSTSSSQSLDMPLLSDLTGESRPKAPSKRPNLTTQRANAPTQRPEVPIQRPDVSVQDAVAHTTISDWSAVYEASSSAPPRRTSIASSHSSDVILVKEEKPFRERTPIELSESEDELVKPQIFQASLTTPVRSLSSSSDSSPERCHEPAATNRHIHFRSPDLSEQSDQSDSELSSTDQSESDGQSAPYREVGMISSKDDDSSKNKNDNAKPTSQTTNCSAEESSDSDCMVLFEATKVGSSRKKSIPTKEKKSKEKKVKCKDKKTTTEKSGKEHQQKKSARKSSQIQPVTTSKGKMPKNKQEKSKRQHTSSSKPKSGDSQVDGLCNDTEGGSSQQCNLGIVIESPSNHSARVKITMESNKVSHSQKGAGGGDMETKAIASEPAIDTEDPIYFLDYSRDEVSHSESAGRKRGYKDIRAHLRYFAKTKLTEKYLGPEKKYKKHNKGHKHS